MVRIEVLRTHAALAALAVVAAACGTRTPLLVGEGLAGPSDASAPLVEAGGVVAVDAGGPSAPRDASPAPEAAPPPLDAALPKDASDLDVESPQCQALHDQVDKLRTEATVCDPSSGAPQCNELADDICCLIWVSSPPPPGAVQFADAVEAYLSQCHPSCGKNPCQVGQNSHCDSTGHCAWGPKGPSGSSSGG